MYTAAYVYDNKLKPFVNQGQLLNVFKTKVRVNEWYGYSLIIMQTTTLYELFNEQGDLLESLNVDHRDCGTTYKSGANQRLYFGGQCAAPQAVTACFKE